MVTENKEELTACDYCGRLVVTARYAHDGDEEDICETCLKWMVARGEVLFEL